jgi:dihydroorotate dehydrogenase (NAD+) catalytic subunit
VETTAGLILDTGAQNPGVKKVIRQYRKSWLGAKTPIIAHLPADEPDDLRRAASALASTEAIAAIELGLPPRATPRDIEHWLRAIREGCMLPLMVKVPLGAAEDLVEVVAGASADVLVVGSPPLGAAVAQPNGETVSGYVYGSALSSITLRDVQFVRELVDLPIVAVGGIHAVAEAQAFLQAGAMAVQIDSLLWIEPQAAAEMALVFSPT